MDITKLPKWAQSHIANLERDVERLNDTLKREVSPDARITRHEFVRSDHIEVPILDNTDRARFRLSIPDEQRKAHSREPIVEVGFLRGMLHSMTMEMIDVRSDHGRLVIYSDSSNAISIGVEQR